MCVPGHVSQTSDSKWVHTSLCKHYHPQLIVSTYLRPTQFLHKAKDSMETFNSSLLTSSMDQKYKKCHSTTDIKTLREYICNQVQATLVKIHLLVQLAYFHAISAIKGCELVCRRQFHSAVNLLPSGHTYPCCTFADCAGAFVE